MKSLYHVLCCALIRYKVGKVCFQTTGTFDVQSHSKVRRRADFEAGIYFGTLRENIAHCFPVVNVALFDLHQDDIAIFLGRLVPDWNVALNTWNATRDSEDAGRREDTTERYRMAQTNHRLD